MYKKTVNLFGLEIENTTMMRALNMARTSLISGERRIFFTPNLEMLDAARRSEEMRSLLNFATVLLPDGDGVLLASSLCSLPLLCKVAGIDFGEGLLKMAEKEKKSVFLLGGRAGVAKRAAKNLMQKHPTLKICGFHNGYFDGNDESRLIAKLQRAAPDIIFVCMGFPRQEQFVRKYDKELAGVKVIACLGGALDIWSGRKLRAPRILQRAHLEWAWRTVLEPKRALRLLKSIPTLTVAARQKYVKIFKLKEIKHRKAHIFK